MRHHVDEPEVKTIFHIEVEPPVESSVYNVLVGNLSQGKNQRNCKLVIETHIPSELFN